MKYFIGKRIVLARTPEGPLAPHIGPFAESLREQGYALASIHRHVLLAACFSRWLQQQGVSLRSITSDHPPRYLRYRMRKVQLGRGDTAALGHLLAFLHCERLIPAERIPSRRLTSAERCAQAYERYLRETRGLAKATIVNYVPFIRSFLKDCFDDGPVMLSRLCASDVVRFVQRQAAHLHQKRAKLLTCALRSFLRYVRYRRQDKAGLSRCCTDRG